MRFLGSDYDGTLTDGGFTKKKLNAISKWRKAGNLFALVSGRSLWDLVTIPPKDGFECDYLIANNGAVLAKADGTVLSAAECELKIAFLLIRHLIELGCTDIWVTTEFPCRVFADDADCDAPGKYTLDTLPEIPWYTQMCTYCPSFEIAKRVVSDVKKGFGEYLNPLQNGQNVDIVRWDINKAHGIRNLTKLLGIEKKDVLVVGNGENDVDMLSAFRSFAMYNSTDAVKEVADHITSGVSDLIIEELAVRR